MEVKKNEVEASKSINEKLSNYCESARLPSIYKVHDHYTRDINDNVCEPRVLAVGPYHRGKQGLKMMEEHKVGYLKSLLARKNENVDRYISAAAKMEQEARNCYAEDVSLSAAEFIEMLVLDGCFIIQLLAKFHSPVSSSAAVAADPIFQKKWILGMLRRDLVLFENQIPFFVLCKLFDLIDEEPNQHGKLIEQFLAFGRDEVYRSNGRDRNLEDVKHLLHLMHATMRPLYPGYVDAIAAPPAREFRLIPTATELKDANVTFRKREGDGNPFKVDFYDGVLIMAPLTIEDQTYRLFRNLIFYEQYSPDNQPTYITDYMVLLDSLVNTARDVEILSESGIIRNLMGDRAMAGLNRDYFSSPWAYISFAGAVLLLVLTFVQTVYSVHKLK